MLSPTKECSKSKANVFFTCFLCFFLLSTMYGSFDLYGHFSLFILAVAPPKYDLLLLIFRSSTPVDRLFFVSLFLLK